MEVRHPFKYDARAASNASRTSGGGPSRTQQQFAKDADINTIVRRFNLTGQLPPPREAGEYGDFSGVSDFQSAMQAVRASQESFMGLPAHLRERFANDPARFLVFLEDEDNVEEARKLGLLPPKPKEAAPKPQESDTPAGVASPPPDGSTAV